METKKKRNDVIILGRDETIKLNALK